MRDNGEKITTNIKDFKTLIVWQKSKCLVNRIYEITEGFPQYEKYHIVDQIRRASTSIKANIAEGVSQIYPMKTINFINTAIGSAKEVEDWIDTAFDLEYIDEDIKREIDDYVAEIVRMLIGYLKMIERKLNELPN